MKVLGFAQVLHIVGMGCVRFAGFLNAWVVESL